MNMTSPIIIATAVESAFGALLNGSILYLVLSRGRKTYHYLFAALLAIFVVWDLGILLIMIRNHHLNELPMIGFVMGVPCAFIQTLIFHFTVVYVRKPIRWAVILVWALTAVSVVLMLLGLAFKIDGTHTYAWGNIFAVVPTPLDPLVFIFWFGTILPACWLLYRHSNAVTSVVERRHARYIMASFLVLAFALVKVLVAMGINVPILLPLGMFLNDIFAAIIGLAIIKDRLLDITVIIRKGTLYSILAAMVVFVFSLSEHLLTTYLSDLIGEGSHLPHLVSIAIVVAIFLPIKQRLERQIEHYFSEKKLLF
jgi:hypothetical protein